MSSQIVSEVAAAASLAAAIQSYSSWYSSVFGAFTSSGNSNGISEVVTKTSAPSSSTVSNEASATGTSSPSSTKSQTSSISTTSTMPSMTTTMKTITTSSSSIASVTASSVNQGKHHDDHLSGGAIAGIVIGVIAAALVIAILAFFCCIRQWLIRRRTRKAEAAVLRKKNEALNEPTDRLKLVRGKVVPADTPIKAGAPANRTNKNGKVAPPRPAPPLHSIAAWHNATRIADAPIFGSSFEKPSIELAQLPQNSSSLVRGASSAGNAARVARVTAHRRKEEIYKSDQSFESIRSSAQTDDTNILATPVAFSEENVVAPSCAVGGAGRMLAVPRDRCDSTTSSFKTKRFVRDDPMDFTLTALPTRQNFSPNGDSPVSPYETMFNRPLAPVKAQRLRHQPLDASRVLSLASAKGGDKKPISAAAAEYLGISSPFDEDARLSYGLGSATGVTGLRNGIGTPPIPPAHPNAAALRLRSDTEGSSEDWGNDVRTTVDKRVRRYGFTLALMKEDSLVEGRISRFDFGFNDAKRESTGTDEVAYF